MRAYNGLIPMLVSEELVSRVGAIAQVEGVHAASVRTLAGDPIAAEPFDDALTRRQVTERLRPFVAG